MSAERKIARELDESMADDRAHRIASAAAEDLIRCEGEATSGIDVPRSRSEGSESAYVAKVPCVPDEGGEEGER